jgi:phosphoribosylaminoimidazolecarboxamide formyltransferase/IMP cyclohydrolase
MSPVPTYSGTGGERLPEAARRDLILASIAIKYTQSNSVAYARHGQLIGVGAGQQSRVDCVKLAGRKVATWYLRQHPLVQALQFKESVRKQDRINARVSSGRCTTSAMQNCARIMMPSLHSCKNGAFCVSQNLFLLRMQVRYIEGDFTETEMASWLECFEVAPAPLSAEDKAAFMQTLDGVSISSDAFFPFRCVNAAGFCSAVVMIGVRLMFTLFFVQGLH